MTERKCPLCDSGISHCDGLKGGYWFCRDGCNMEGPVDDEDGTQFDRLLALPDPREEHHNLPGWQAGLMMERFGGEARCGNGLWYKDGFNFRSFADYSWRPKREPRVIREEGLHIMDIRSRIWKSVNLVDGKSCWMEHEAGIRYRWLGQNIEYQEGQGWLKENHSFVLANQEGWTLCRVED